MIARLPTPPSLLTPFVVRVGGEDVQIPGRIYNAELSSRATDSFSTIERSVLACLYTRHHDGYVRQRHLRDVIQLSHPWVVPFVVQLIGEYVIEILWDIQRALGQLDTAPQRAQYGVFAADNASFVDVTARRVTSYWNCYYRHLTRDDYPGFALIASLRSAATGQA